MPKELKFPLLAQLQKSLVVLKHRRDMLPKYIDQPDSFTGKNHYTPEMIPKVEHQIDEMKAAIKGIEEWRAKQQKEAREARKKANQKDFDSAQADTKQRDEVVSDRQGTR